MLLFATVALPARAREVMNHDVAFRIKQRRQRSSLSPVHTVPGVDLEPCA
jgi:hypothetical protein